MKRHKIIYQIYPLSFMDSNNDGKGDINGIISKLEYLRDLGVTDIWISPIFKTGFADNGYDVKDYYAIDPVFGKMEDFDSLVKKAKMYNIGIIMDLVMNHTSIDNDWFKKSIKGEKKFREFYIWRNKPLEMESQFENSAWKYINERHQYYYHHFSSDQPDLNWDNPFVLNEFVSVLNFWINKGVKGFRFDVIDMLGKDVENNKIIILDRAYSRIRKLGQKTWLKEKDFFTVGEAWSTNTKMAKKYIGINDGVFTTHFHGSYIFKGWEKSRWESLPFTKDAFNDFRYSIFKKWEDSSGLVDLPIFIENHDIPRAIDRWLPNNINHQLRSKIIAVTFYGLPGIPFIYQGQEFGLGNPNFDSLSSFNDPETKKYIKNNSKNKKLFETARVGTRDNARAMIPWNDEVVNKINWLNEATYNTTIEKLIKKKNNVHFLYDIILKLRSQNSELFSRGNVKVRHNKIDGLVWYEIEKDGKTFGFIANWFDKEIKTNLSEYNLIFSENCNSNTIKGYGIFIGVKK